MTPRIVRFVNLVVAEDRRTDGAWRRSVDLTSSDGRVAWQG